MSLKNRKKNRRTGTDVRGEFFGSRTGYDKKYGDRRSRVVGPVLIACAIIAVLVAADYMLNSGKIYRGVEVGNVALGGMTPAKAEETVRERATGALKEIELDGPELFTRTAGEMGVDFNVEATVEDAYAVGREGNILQRLKDRGGALVGGVTIPPDVDYRSEKARAEVEQIASRLNNEPQEAAVNIYGSEAEVIESREGYKLDVAATMENIDRAVEDMTGKARIAGEVLEPQVTTSEAEAAAEKIRQATSEQLVFKADGKSWTVSPRDVGSSLDVTRQDGKLQVSLDERRLEKRLAHMYADLTVRPVEASYKVNGSDIAVTPSKEGSSIETEKLLAAVKGGLFEGQREYQVPVAVDKPEFTTTEAEKLKPTTLLGSYRTNYTLSTDTSTERVENLQIASGAVSGTLLAPGEVFSMNDTVSHLDYHETHVIVNGAETTADGGGLCQVTSTLYNAANYAGLDVIERHPHYSQLPYIRPGLDATIWFGSLDMKFENTTDGYLLLQEYVADDGYIYAEIYGRPTGTEVKLWSEPSYMGNDASKWVTYMTKKQDGKVVFDGVLHTDDYLPLIDEHGKKIPPPKVPVAPVNP